MLFVLTELSCKGGCPIYVLIEYIGLRVTVYTCLTSPCLLLLLMLVVILTVYIYKSLYSALCHFCKVEITTVASIMICFDYLSKMDNI